MSAGSRELAQRLRDGGQFQVAAFKSWAASEIVDPDALDAVMALIDAYDRSRQVVVVKKPREEIDVDVRVDLLTEKVKVRRLERKIRLMEHETRRAAILRHDSRPCQHADLLELLGITVHDFEAVRSRIAGLSPDQVRHALFRR